jgi:hypothetical protein
MSDVADVCTEVDKKGNPQNQFLHFQKRFGPRRPPRTAASNLRHPQNVGGRGQGQGRGSGRGGDLDRGRAADEDGGHIILRSTSTQRLSSGRGVRAHPLLMFLFFVLEVLDCRVPGRGPAGLTGPSRHGIIKEARNSTEHPLIKACTAMRSLLILTFVQLTCAFYMHSPFTSVSGRPALRNAVTRGKWHMDTIPDFFPSDWGRRGGGLGEGGVRIPDSFSVDGMEKEKQGGRTAVLERPTQRTDPGKKYKVCSLTGDFASRCSVMVQ